MGACAGKPKAHDDLGAPVVKATTRTKPAPQPVFARPLYAHGLLRVPIEDDHLHRKAAVHAAARLLPLTHAVTRGRCKLRTDARVRDVYKIGRTLGSGGAPVSVSARRAQLPCVSHALSCCLLQAEQTGALRSVLGCNSSSLFGRLFSRQAGNGARDRQGVCCEDYGSARPRTASERFREHTGVRWCFCVLHSIISGARSPQNSC